MSDNVFPPELPVFSVLSLVRTNGEVVVTGDFDRSDGVREGRAILYRPGGASVDGELTALVGLKATIVVDPYYVDRITVGSRWPYFDGFWQPEFVEAVLDPSTRWVRVRLVPHDAIEYRISERSGPSEGVIEEGEDLPVGARAIRRIPNGFDRVTCHICDRKIGPKFLPFAFRREQDVGGRNSFGIWLCEDDYHNFVERRSAAFLL